MGRLVRLQPSHQRMSDVIGTIYDSAIDPDRWSNALQEMCGLIDSFFGSLTIVDSLRPSLRLASRWGGDPYWIDLLDRKYANMMPFISVLDKFDIGQPFNNMMMMEQLGDTHVMDGPFTTEWATPAGVRDAANVILMRSKHRMAIVNLSTHLNRAPVTQPELDIVGILAPHIRRALSISDLIDLKSLAADTFERMLDSLHLGVIAVDTRFQIRHANQIASEMIAAGSPLSTRGGKVVVPGSPASTMVLHEAISRAGSDESTMAGTGAGVPLRFSDGRPAIAHILPLRRGEIRRGGGVGAAAAIFIATPTDVRHAPIDALANLYGLTTAEARLLDQLADGKNRSQAAASLSIADSTAKTHLERIFTKTGASTQAELSRILTSLSAPVMPA